MIVSRKKAPRDHRQLTELNVPHGPAVKRDRRVNRKPDADRHRPDRTKRPLADISRVYVAERIGAGGANPGVLDAQ
jgi:hypothetical protein